VDASEFNEGLRRTSHTRFEARFLNMLVQIADKGAGFHSLANAWADTTTSHGRLMLTVLGGLSGEQTSKAEILTVR
jgi:DNA invertase Pin-like site-specific DNA recombinase